MWDSLKLSKSVPQVEAETGGLGKVVPLTTK